MNNQDFETYLPVYDDIPQDWEQARTFLVEQLRRIANGVNSREVGFFLEQEVLAGKQFTRPAVISGTSEQFRTVFRKVIDFGALPNTGSQTQPHGLTFDSNFTLIDMYGAATDPSTEALPMPNVEIDLRMDTSDITITTTADYSGFTRSYVVIEYLKEP